MGAGTERTKDKRPASVARSSPASGIPGPLIFENSGPAEARCIPFRGYPSIQSS